MIDLYELTDEHMYQYNDFCIRAIAEYLGITLFKTKAKGDNKEKMFKIINQKLKENQIEDEKKIL
jgi:predicted RecB family nuclease